MYSLESFYWMSLASAYRDTSPRKMSPSLVFEGVIEERWSDNGVIVRHYFPQVEKTRYQKLSSLFVFPLYPDGRVEGLKVEPGYTVVCENSSGIRTRLLVESLHSTEPKIRGVYMSGLLGACNSDRVFAVEKPRASVQTNQGKTKKDVVGKSATHSSRKDSRQVALVEEPG